MSRTPPVRSILSLAALAWLPASAQDASGFHAAFDLVPPDSAAALVIPNLKGASDQLAQALEGMDRANVLFGGRPVDQVRALLGLTAGVNEQAPVAIITPTVDALTTPVFLVPVIDAADFMETNFDPDPSGTAGAFVHHGTGNTVFTRTIDKHIAICEDQAVLGSFTPRPGFAQRLGGMFDAAVVERAAKCDMFLYQRSDAALAMRDRAAGGSEHEGIVEVGAEQNATLPIVQITSMVPTVWWESAEAALMGANFDPLGIGLYSFVALKSDSHLGAMARSAGSAGTPLAKVPDAPFYVAASADFAGMGGSALFFDEMMIEWNMLAEQIKSMHVIVSPSPLGLQGGLLNGASIFLATDDPAGLINAMKTQYEFIALAEQDSLALAPTWQENARQIDGVSVHAYKIDATYSGNNTNTNRMLPLALGRSGFSGFIAPVEGGVIVTCSQRPDVFSAALKAVKGEAQLAQNQMLAQMATWLPTTPDILLFFGLGETGNLLNQLMSAFGPLLPFQFTIPPIDPATKPIGVGIDIRPGLIESGAVLPSDAAAVVLDAFVEQFQLLEPAEGGGQ